MRATFALCLLLAAPAARAGTPQPVPAAGVHRPHRATWLQHRADPVPHRAWRVAPGPLQPDPSKQGHFVFGYLPYWQLDYDDFRWDLLTHLAYFAVEIQGDGALGSSHKFMDASTAALIAEAHANGVAVVLTATNFDDDQVGVICNSPALRAKVIDGLVAMITAQGADGVNIDFEFVPKSAKAGFVTFLQELKAAVDAAVPGGGHVSIAGPAVDWWGSYDYDQIAAAIDAIFIMAYGYHYSGGNPGPLCPLSSGGVWGKHTLPWTIDDYVTWGGEGIRAKLVAGLPVYGYDWPSTSAAVPGSATGKGTAVVYSKAKKDGPGHGWQWDAASQTPYYMYESGGWHQVWADTAESLALKFEYAVEQQLGGIGFWALGYDAGDEALWSAVEGSYPPAVVGGEDVGGGTDAGGGDPGGGDDVVADAGGEGDAATDAHQPGGDAAPRGGDAGEDGGEDAGKDTGGAGADAASDVAGGGDTGPGGGGPAADTGGVAWGEAPDSWGASSPDAGVLADAPSLGGGKPAGGATAQQAASEGCSGGPGAPSGAAALVALAALALARRRACP